MSLIYLKESREYSTLICTYTKGLQEEVIMRTIEVYKRGELIQSIPVPDETDDWIEVVSH